MDDFDRWLASQVCVECGDRATHRTTKGKVCNAHLDGQPARALND